MTTGATLLFSLGILCLMFMVTLCYKLHLWLSSWGFIRGNLLFLVALGIMASSQALVPVITVKQGALVVALAASIALVLRAIVSLVESMRSSRLRRRQLGA